MPDKPLTIGRLARAAGVNVETVRYYQRLGLVARPPRPAAGYRLYDKATIHRIQFIKRAQCLGFSLREIARLLELGEGQCDDVRAQAERRRRKIEAQIQELMLMKARLERLIGQCRDSTPGHGCPIVSALNES
ncbi:MAG TPA: MerR family transcriptional regulator [Chromatiales bacterium]|nr:MerR family transcriptional regulator [Chromatiales bacterium]